MSLRFIILIGAVMSTCLAAAPPMSNVPPSASADVPLSDHRWLHARELPLARLDGVVRDGAQFDALGSRVAFLATFPTGSVDGDWRRVHPTQAYIADIARRMLVQLTSDGRATSIAWKDPHHVIVRDGSTVITYAVSDAQRIAGRLRVRALTPSASGTLVTPSDEFRLQVFKAPDQSYLIGQVGAVRLRTIAVAPNRACALVGSFVVWVDASKNGGGPFARGGPDTVATPYFPTSAYGRSLTPVLPLGHAAYQGAYRNGIAYFAFSFGLARIVAATTDFLNYFYPRLPAQPSFTVGDGFGAGPDGTTYFAGPEVGNVQFWRDNKYVERPLRFPADASDDRRLIGWMRRLSPNDALEPPMRPDADALDGALLEWRVYPIGDTTGDRWIASHLGRVFLAGANRQLQESGLPGFPFAVLGRTDDGRIWGAMPVQRTSNGSAVVRSTSRLMFTRDGRHWQLAAVLSGDPGAVGMYNGTPWVAMTAYEGDASGVEVVRLDGGTTRGASTGAVYGGEDMFFAKIASGWYLVCGAEPGTRYDDTSGPLVALKLDTASLFMFDALGRNVYLGDRLDPMHLLSQATPSPIVVPSVDALGALRSPYVTTLVSNPPFASTSSIRSLSADAENQFEVEYAWRPYPTARVNAAVSGDAATVLRTLERGPLAVDGQTERWTRDVTGRWRLSSVSSSWHL